MKITDVRVFKVNVKSNLLANASITFDNSLVVWVKLCTGRNGEFLNFPCHKFVDENNDEQWKDDVFPLSKEFRDEMTDAVIDAYNDADKKVAKTTKKTTRK